MAQQDAGPICQDTGMPTFVVHTPVGVNQIQVKRAIHEAVAEATGAASCGPIRWIRSPARTAATIWAKRRR
jgi:fumarate hydratase class I